MSYILDALRKSQQARHPGAAPVRGAVHNVSLNLPVSGWWLALGIVLLAGMVVAGLIFWLLRRPASLSTLTWRAARGRPLDEVPRRARGRRRP